MASGQTQRGKCGVGSHRITKALWEAARPPSGTGGSPPLPSGAWGSRLKSRCLSFVIRPPPLPARSHGPSSVMGSQTFPCTQACACGGPAGWTDSSLPSFGGKSPSSCQAQLSSSQALGEGLPSFRPVRLHCTVSCSRTHRGLVFFTTMCTARSMFTRVPV